MELVAALDTQHPRDLDLRQDDVPRQRSDQAVVKDLLGSRQRSLGIERPVTTGPGSLASFFPKYIDDHADDNDQQDEDKQFHHNSS